MRPGAAHRLIGAGLCILALWGTVAAQETRVAQIAQQQADKAQRLRPENSPAAEDVITRVMSSPLLSGSGGVYPWFGTIYNGTGLGLGAGYLRRAARDSRLNLTAAGTTNGSVSVDGNWRMRVLTSTGHLQPFVNARWSRLRDVPFNGIGQGTTESDRTLFDYRPREGHAGVQAVMRAFSVSGSLGYMKFATSGDDSPASLALTGLGETLAYAVGRVDAGVDWRPSRGSYNTRGGFLRGNWRRHATRGPGHLSFDQIEGEAAQLIPFVREEFGLAFRALATTTRTVEGDEVPFILLPSIGGGDTVRGLANRRFQDRSRVVLNAEYRWRPSRYVDLALFVDSGSVAPRIKDIEIRRFQTGYGIGARFHGPGFTALRVETARGPDSWHVVFGGGLPF